jgi:hypothetical protein
METSPTIDPFAVLGVSIEATEEEVRGRYLDLVRQYPPERDPAKFREIRAAFDAIKDPLLIAQRLVVVPNEDMVPKWLDAIKDEERKPPILTPAFILSLGNRDSEPRDGAGASGEAGKSNE